MKSKTLTFISKMIVVLSVVFALNCVFRVVPLKYLSADSGFDSDSDSGSSISSDGDSSGGDLTGLVLILAIGMFIYLLCTEVGYETESTDECITSDTIHKLMGEDFDINEFNKMAFKIYKDVQIAWMNRDIEKVRDVLSDTMFNMYKTQLLTLEVKHQKNMMEEITYVDSHISNIINTNSYKEIELILKVTCKDYLINENTGKVLRGRKDKINHYTYKLNFKCDIVTEDNSKCPSCGAKLDDANSIKCKHCKSTIVRKSKKWVLTQKRMLEQR